MLSKNQSIILLSLILFVFAFGLLNFHRIPEGYSDSELCAENFRIFNDYWVVLNCDSYQFMRLAANPAILLEPDTPIGSRPGMVWLVNPVFKLISPLREIIANSITLAPDRLPPHWTLDLGFAYPIYIALNFLIVGVSLFLFVSMLNDNKTVAMSAVLIGAIFAVNDVTKMFLMTPHTGIMIIIVSIFSHWGYNLVRYRGWFESPKIYLLSVICGLLLLSYPAFIVFIPAILCAQLFRLGINGIKQKWAHLISRSFMIGLIAALPMGTWILFLIYRNGAFTPVETQRYNQIFWMQTAWQDGTLIQQLLIKAGEVIQLSSPYHLFILGYLIIISWILLGQEIKQLFSKPSLLILSDGLFNAALFLVFFCLTGRIKNRLAFSIIPALVISIGQVIDLFTRKSTKTRLWIANGVSILFVMLLIVSELWKLGPFS